MGLQLADADLAHYPANQKTAWAMAALIHCDFCRLVIAYDECEREGLARLLSMADISSKLVEARNWYNKSGSKLLKEIGAIKPCGVETVTKRIEEIKTAHAIHRVNRYVEYRNKFGYHYDENAIIYLQKFEGESGEDFFEILSSFVRFAGEWAQLTKNLIKTDAP